jgi:hypothetical protein
VHLRTLPKANYEYSFLTNPVPCVYDKSTQKKVVRKRSIPVLTAERDVRRLKDVPETGGEKVAFEPVR